MSYAVAPQLFLHERLWYWLDEWCFEPKGPFESREECEADYRVCRPPYSANELPK